MLSLHSVIKLARLNGSEIVVNAELIERIESNPDTTLCLATGTKVIVKNSADDVIEKIMDYRRALCREGKSPAEVLLKNYQREGK